MNDLLTKLSKTNKTFVDRLQGSIGASNLGTFCAFPEEVEFNGQESEEHIILLVRQHLAVLIPQYLVIIILLLAPILFFFIFRGMPEIGFGLMFGSGFICWLVALSFAVDTFFKWYFTVNIITDQRVIDVDFDNVLYHKFSEATLEKIEDVSHAPAGLLSSIFDYGDVFLQTAGTEPEFKFKGVPRPRDVQDTLLDLIEMADKGQI